MEENNKFLYLVKVEPNANNNKFYRMIQINENSFKVEYGRIGNGSFQTSSYSISQWNKKLKEKLRKGYIDQSRLVAEVKVENKESNKYLEIENTSIRKIVDRLQAMAKQAIRDNYTVSSNNVTQMMIDEAQLLLDKLINDNSITNFNKMLVELFKVIPRKMHKVADYLAKSKDDISNIIQREQDLLDVMKGQVVQQNIIKEENIEETELPTKTILETLGLTFEEITEEEEKLIKKNLGSISDKYYQAWKIVNIRTQEKFNKFIKDNKINNKKLLWHGSRNENFWSIINNGLVLRPSAVITGKMFGYGIYFAPKARKSFGYTSYHGSYWAGGNSNSAFMCLFDVAYGKPYDVYSFDSKYYKFNYENLQESCKGANCLHAHEGNMLRNDEIIVYKEEQITIKYLVELR